jgi:hypothetical protein
VRTTLSLSSAYPQPTLRLPLSLPSAYPQPTLSSPRAAAPGEPAASGGQSAGRLDNLQPYYLRLVDDGTPELKIIRAMCAMGALKLVSSKEGGNEYEAAADIQPNTPLLVYGGKLCDVGASPSEHARYVKELEYKLTYIDGYPYDADGKTILLPETHHGSLLNEPKNGQASACFKDIHPCALNRGPYVRGLLPPLKIVCAGSKGIATGQKVTVKYAPWGGVSGVAHPHRASAASQSSSSTTHTAGELDADAAGESTAAAIEPAAVVNVGGCGHCPSPTLPSPCFHCCYHGNGRNGQRRDCFHSSLPMECPGAGCESCTVALLRGVAPNWLRLLGNAPSHRAWMEVCAAKSTPVAGPPFHTQRRRTAVGPHRHDAQ